MTATPLPPRNILSLGAMLVVAAGIGLARADGKPPVGNPDADAARLADEVMREAGGTGEDSLGAWSRSIIDRALKRAGGNARQTVPASRLGGRDRSGGASPPDRRPGQAALRAGGAGPGTPGRSDEPLPAERHAGRLAGTAAGRAVTAEVLIFTSLSVPAASWRQWSQDAALAGAPLVLRGVGAGGLPPDRGPGLAATAKQIGERLSGAQAGVAIDPRLFRLFGVTRVPAVAVVPGGVPPCRSRGCAEDAAPPHDLVTGNIGLAAALEAVADEGAVGHEVAKAFLERLGRER